MAQTYPLAAGWTPAARYTAVGVVETLIINPDFSARSVLRWTVTQGDEIPAISVDAAAGVRPGEDREITLNDGDRLWLAGVPGKNGTLEF